jgi:23S rRNA (pseudouridine1915-N3)-methyltransferase
MSLWLFTVAGRKPSGVAATLIEEYLGRAGHYMDTALQVAATEGKMLAAVERAGGRTRPWLILADSAGELLTSVQLAGELSRQIDLGTQLVVLAIGPADGWSAAARERADRMVSFGRMTLPHELAAVVAAEQLYRALTIRAGHPYHSGH